MEVIDMIQQFEPFVKKICAKIVARNGYSTNYNLVLSATMNEKYVGAIKAGATPTILINALKLAPLIAYDAGKVGSAKGAQLRYVLGQLLERAERMEHTLSLTPSSSLVALPYEGKRFVKEPKKVFSVNKSSIGLTYFVIATNALTGNEVQFSTSNLNSVEECARMAVEKLIQTDNLMSEQIIEESPEQPKIDPASIKYGSIAFEHNEVNGVKLSFDAEDIDNG